MKKDIDRYCGTKRIAVLITCYNRKDHTLGCLECLFKNQPPVGFSLEAFLVDDGSTDGTSQAIRNAYPDVNIIQGDGSLFWNGGMRMAFSAAIQQGFDYYLWLNDDTKLYDDTLSRMLATEKLAREEHNAEVIVVGATRDPEGDRQTYGGLVAVDRWKPLKFSFVKISEQYSVCDTMNGNCVLIPKSVVDVIGNLDKAFVHAMGDIDYGLRAKRAGFLVVAMAGYAGECSQNCLANTHIDVSLGRMERFKKVSSNKELPLKSWYVFTKRNAGVMWPVYFAWPYVKVLLGR